MLVHPILGLLPAGVFGDPGCHGVAGAPYAADIENRRRTRYAWYLQGLYQLHGYVPVNNHACRLCASGGGRTLRRPDPGQRPATAFEMVR